MENHLLRVAVAVLLLVWMPAVPLETAAQTAPDPKEVASVRTRAAAGDAVSRVTPTGNNHLEP